MAIEFKLPELGENIESGDVVNVLVSEGETVGPNQGVIELETDKAVVEIPCARGGRVTKIHVQKGQTIKVGEVILTLEAEAPAAEEKPKPVAVAAEQPKAPAAPPTRAPRTVAAAGPEPIPTGPAARRLARETGVDLRQVRGSGTGGRVTLEDVQAAVSAGAEAAGRGAVAPPGEPGEDAWGPVRRDKLSRIRQTIAAQMVRSATTIPHVTNFDDADVTDLERLRKGVPEGYVGPDVKLTAMPFVMKAVALALERHPVLNASLDEEHQQIVYKQYVNLGVAVDTPRGLVVPVVRGVERLSVPQIARELGVLARRVRAVEFGIEELRAGTFTISNMGAVGGSYCTPIINYPEVAVLLLGRSRWAPTVRDGEIKIRLMLPLSLSYDHRVVDGAAAARFLNDLIDNLQSPGRLLLTE